MHQVLLHNPFEDHYFDFEGSDIPGVKGFFESFGPNLDTYVEYIKWENSVPALIGLKSS